MDKYYNKNKLMAYITIIVMAVFIIMYNINTSTMQSGTPTLDEIFYDGDIDYNTRLSNINYPQETTVNYSNDYEYNTFFNEHEEMPNRIIKIAKEIENFSKQEIFRAPVITGSTIIDTILGIFTIPINIIAAMVKLTAKVIKVCGAYPDYDRNINVIDAIFIKGKTDFTYGSSYGGGGGGGNSR